MRKGGLISALVLFTILIGITMTVVTVSYAESKSMPDASSAGEEVDVWLIAGQSNAVGYGNVSAYPSEYAENMARIGGTITLDLGGNTLTEKTSMGNTGVVDCLGADGNAKKAILNIRNGNLIMRDFGIIFNSSDSGSYHIRSYYNFVKTDSIYKNNSALIKIAERFPRYCQSAEAYQNNK